MVDTDALDVLFFFLTNSWHLLQKAAEKKEEGDLKPVKEVEIKQSDKDPNHESGCTIS